MKNKAGIVLFFVTILILGCDEGEDKTPSDAEEAEEENPCEEGLTFCNDECVNLDTDRHNCGSCGRECMVDEMCIEGNCEELCPPGMSNCGGVCVYIFDNPNHCGGCFIKCEEGQECVGYSCQ